MDFYNVTKKSIKKVSRKQLEDIVYRLCTKNMWSWVTGLRSDTIYKIKWEQELWIFQWWWTATELLVNFFNQYRRCIVSWEDVQYLNIERALIQLIEDLGH